MSLLTLLTGVLFLIIGVIIPFITLKNYTYQNGGIGIIGGADTPTYEFVVFRILNGWPFVTILFGSALIVSALFCLIFSKTVKNNCSIKTTVLSLGLSAILEALTSYYTSISCNFTRAQYFKTYIDYQKAKSMIYYELIDKELLNKVSQHIITPSEYLGLINNEQYHMDIIFTNYHDTYAFLYSLQKGLADIV